MKQVCYKTPPKHCIVPGTNFTVDWHCRTDPKYIHSFLSHAHSDHINGIGSFRSPRVLHCTPITAKMILLKFPKLSTCIETHEIGTTAKIENVEVHFFDANHTPGSAMFLFIFPSGKRILHTGDFRAEDSVANSIRSFSPIDYLYMDCTYGTSKLNILPRDSCVKFICDRSKDESHKNSLILVGTYTIGKEELVINISKELGIPVYVPDDRYRSIQGLIDCNYVPQDVFVRDASKTKLHLVSLMECGDVESANYAKKLGYDNVICIRASGWGGKAFWQTPIVSSIDGVTVSIYNVPYSDHSSPEQLINFVKVCRPSKVTSITQFTAKEIAKLDKMFFKYIRKDTNKRFIDYYYASPPRPTLPMAVGKDEREKCVLSV